MKKLMIILTVCSFLLSFAACIEGENKALDSSSLPEQSTEESSSLQDSSVSEDYSSEDSKEATSEESKSQVKLSTRTSKLPQKAAVGYNTIYTKPSELNALSCNTATVYHKSEHSVTAVYDGSVTHFLGAISGEYYRAEQGEWTRACCGGFFNADGDNWIRFEFEKDTDKFLYAEKILHGHGGGIVYNFYTPSTGKTYSFVADEDDYELYECDGTFICVERTNDDLSEFLEGTFDKADNNEKYGLTNNGKIVIPFEYDCIETLNTKEFGAVGVVLAIKDGRSYYLSTDGTTLTPDGFDCGSEPFENRAWVFNDGNGYIIEFYA